MEPKIVGERIKKLIKANQMTKEEVAKKIGIKNKSFEKKLMGKEEFYIEEIVKLTEIFHLNIDECEEIFFHENQETLKS